MNTTHRLASAILAAVTTLGALTVTPALPAAAACDPATHSLQFLAANVAADGSLDQSLAETSDLVLGAAAGGIDPATIAGSSGKTPFDFFAADLGATTPKTYADANQLGKVIQAVVAGHRDPEAFAGKALLTKLTTPTTSGGMYDTATGAYLDSTSGSNQAFTQAQAVLALAAAHNAGFPIPAAAVTELKSLRSTSGATKGGWSAFGSFDTNTTAMALMALAAAGDTHSGDATVYDDAFSFLHSQQDAATGGFLFSTDFSTASDPDSDALVIQALVASGEQPGGASWSNANGNAGADILTFQDPASGGFVFEHGGKIQDFATSEVPAALKSAPFPIRGSYLAGARLPAAGCPTAAVEAAVTAAPGLPAAGRPALSIPPDAAMVVAVALTGLALMGLAAIHLARRG